MNTKSLLIVDVEASIAVAYQPKLSKVKRQETQAHLAHFLSVAKEPNTLIQRSKDAILFLQEEDKKEKHWHERPLGVLAITAVSGLIVSLVAWKFGLNK